MSKTLSHHAPKLEFSSENVRQTVPLLRGSRSLEYQ